MGSMGKEREGYLKEKLRDKQGGQRSQRGHGKEKEQRLEKRKR